MSDYDVVRTSLEWDDNSNPRHEPYALPALGRIQAREVEQWCLPQRDHWHVGPLSFYYTKALRDHAEFQSEE